MMGGVILLCGLNEIRLGNRAVVIHMEGAQTLLDRLKDFGLVPGTAVRCRYRGPGDAMTALECRGSVIALRTRELEGIRVRWDG